MEIIGYRTRNLEQACSSERAAKRLFGDQVARKIKLRVKDVESADLAPDLFLGPGKWHALQHEGLAGCLAGSLTANWRFIVRPDGWDAEVGWSGVSAVEIWDICDYHGR